MKLKTPECRRVALMHEVVLIADTSQPLLKPDPLLTLTFTLNF